ncbi:STAS domain-containing protein [Streptomyces sp. NPDC003042]
MTIPIDPISGAPTLSAAGALPAPPDAQDPQDPLPRIRSALHDGVLAVSLAGEFDHYTCAALRGLLDEGAARGARRLVVDAALVSFCDSALLHVLDRWTLNGRPWELAAASRAVRFLLTVSARVRTARAGREQVSP